MDYHSYPNCAVCNYILINIHIGICDRVYQNNLIWDYMDSTEKVIFRNYNQIRLIGIL